MSIDYVSNSISQSSSITLCSFVLLYHKKYRCHGFSTWTKKLRVLSDDIESFQGYSLLFPKIDEPNVVPKEF